MTIVDNDIPEAVGPVVIKKSRAAKSEVQPEKSKALKHMPEWIRDELSETKGHIIPTLIDFYGCQENPWELDYQGREVFLWLAQVVIDYLFPNVHYNLQKSDNIYAKVRTICLLVVAEAHIIAFTTLRFVRAFRMLEAS
jgi:hypothetical protein